MARLQTCLMGEMPGGGVVERVELEVSSMGLVFGGSERASLFGFNLGRRSWHQSLGSMSRPERPSAERVYGVGIPSPI